MTYHKFTAETLDTKSNPVVSPHKGWYNQYLNTTNFSRKTGVNGNEEDYAELHTK